MAIVKVLMPEGEHDEPIVLVRDESGEMVLKMKWSHKIQDKFGKQSGYFKIQIIDYSVKILERVQDQTW